ncbi:MAG: carboxypeptidase-like regulatory domain-containing protein, partial [Bacteroides sp.]|nr:carboxypeptidase-like regulatory domain-containing protein [Bacteroides sp.]
VVDEHGEGMIGVNIVVKGTSNGTITDIDGNFSLKVSEGNVLNITSIGYISQHVTVGNQKSLRVVLIEDA